MPLSGVYGGVCDMKTSQGEVSSATCCSEGAEHNTRRHCIYQSWPASHGQDLDQEMWSKLPIELLERVIASLPIDAMLRLRSVCKAWKAYISSYGFVIALSLLIGLGLEIPFRKLNHMIEVSKKKSDVMI